MEFQFPNIPKNPSGKRKKKAWGEEARMLLSKEIEISLLGDHEAFGLGLKSGTPGLDLLITKHYAIRSCG